MKVFALAVVLVGTMLVLSPTSASAQVSEIRVLTSSGGDILQRAGRFVKDTYRSPAARRAALDGAKWSGRGLLAAGAVKSAPIIAGAATAYGIYEGGRWIYNRVSD